MYKAFTRTWWKVNKSWPNGLEPHAGRKTWFPETFQTDAEASAFCREWNGENPAGRLSRKAEYTEA